MIKLIIFGVLGVLVGVGGGSAISVMSAKKAFTAFQADRAKSVADSIAAGGEHGEGGDHPAPSEPEPATAPADSSTLVHALPPVTTPEAATHEKPHAPEGTTATPAASQRHEPAARAPKPASTSRAVATIESHGNATAAPARPRLPALPPKPIEASVAAAAEKVSKIFGAMPAKDAAKVLEQLDDAEVQSILAGLSDKQAASIMQHLPPQRAAAISKLVLRGGRS